MKEFLYIFLFGSAFSGLRKKHKLEVIETDHKFKFLMYFPKSKCVLGCFYWLVYTTNSSVLVTLNAGLTFHCT